MNKNKIRKIRRWNAKIFPVYKMFSWDLLFFYSIQFLYYTITKAISTKEVLIANSLLLLFKIFGKRIAVVIANKFGGSKSIVIGNLLVIINLLILILVPGFIGIILSNFFMAIGFDIKEMCEDSLLFDSVSTHGGSGLYSKINSRGCGLYYLFDGAASLFSGYLFVINNNLPIYISLCFVIISTLISLSFRDIHEVSKQKSIYKRRKISTKIRRMRNQSLDYFRKVLKSSRLRSFIFFNFVFFSLIMIMDTYLKDSFLKLGVSEERYARVYAIANIVSGFTLFLVTKIEKLFKNRTLTIMSFWYTIKYKYLMNFSVHTERNAMIYVSIVFFILLIISILYMRDRFGLKPSKYNEKDIRLGI